MTPRWESENKDASPLGKPLEYHFSGKTAPNRFLKAAMTERLSTWSPNNLEERGVPTPELINVYKRWGEGSLGCILSGNIMLDYKNLEAAGNPIIPPNAPTSGERFEAFKKMGSAAKAHGSLIVGQLSHPGRQVTSMINDKPISASDVQLEGNVMGMTFSKPRAATQEDINDIVNNFTNAAVYLHKAGWDGVELHGAHGYLLSQFLSQTTNKRTDKYGGSLENRARIILEIASSIRKALPAKETGFILSIKINSVEFQEGGFTTDDAKKLCHLLEEAEFDFVELSGGTYQSLAFKHKRESTRKRESFFLDFADQIVPSLTKTRTYVTGGFHTVDGMVAALKTVDGVGLARAVCQEFHLPRDMLANSVSGAILQKVDQDDFGMTNVIAGSQIRQVGRDKEPIDMGLQENVDGFMKDMQKWGKGMEEDQGKGEKFGYVDVESVRQMPYAGQVEV